MTERKFLSWLAKHEGKKHQASIGDIREIWKLIKMNKCYAIYLLLKGGTMKKKAMKKVKAKPSKKK